MISELTVGQPDKPHIERRIKDWKKRIDDLYAIISVWLKDTGCTIKRGSPVLMYEELMENVHIGPTEVDTADIYRNGKIILSLKPRGLWIIGANGGIDLLSLKKSYILVDDAKQFEKPSWKMLDSQTRKSADFNKETLTQLLK